MIAPAQKPSKAKSVFEINLEERKMRKEDEKGR